MSTEATIGSRRRSRHEAVSFPAEQPAGYEWLDDEPMFDPGVHLALTEPDDVIMLEALGYDVDETADTATPVAISEPFRILSDVGAEVMLDTARRLRRFARPAAERIERTVRGGVYRSRWLRDLCISEDVAAHLSRIYRTDVAPHPMGLHLGHLNYEPSVIDAAVDKWHHDTLPLDIVMTVTDPKVTPGGRFEYFRGTKAEAAEMRAAGRVPDPDRIVAPALPGPGWAVALHGNMVVHRGGPLTARAERITMVNGYVALDPVANNQSRTIDLLAVDDPDVLFAEWTRFAAWRASARLQQVIDGVRFGVEPVEAARLLEQAVSDVAAAAREMQATSVDIEHYE
jgi:hypothetical protein